MVILSVYSLAQTLDQEVDVSVGHPGGRHVHDAAVGLALHRTLGLCGENRLMQSVLGVQSSPRDIKMMKLKSF